jgi:hypothetical protein
MHEGVGGRLLKGVGTLFAGLVGIFTVALLALASSALAVAPDPPYEFGVPNVIQAGPETTVFDHSTQACQQDDIPDIAARAFKDSLGRTQLVVSHYNTRREIGTALDNVTHDCNVVLWSDVDSDPSHYNDAEWLHTMYSLDGQTVYGLIHHEYQGWNFNETCANLIGTPDINKCWYNSITFATSTDSGNNYTQAPVPNHLLASVPYQFTPLGGPLGIYRPSNIVAKDGYYYFIVLAQAPAGSAQKNGVCVMRSNNLASPTSWRAWDGDSYSVRWINPYVETSEPPSAHVCEPISEHALRGIEVNSLTYNSYYGKYMVVGSAVKNVPGFFFSLSDDLIHWTEPQLLMEGEIPQASHVCGDPDPVRDGSVLDPSSSTRNFETVDQTANLYFTRFNYFYSGQSCSMTLDRDLIKYPIQFAGQEPNAAFSINVADPDIGDSIQFLTSGSSDSDGVIDHFEWDLDGDGDFETFSGANPVYSFDKIKTNNIGLRVVDNTGLADEQHEPLRIGAKVDAQPDFANVQSQYVEDMGASYTDARGYGWVRQDSLGNPTHTPISMSANAVDRDPYNKDQYAQKLDSVIFMQYPSNGSNPRLVKTAGAFEISAPCGIYSVSVGVGDSAFSSMKTKPGDQSVHQINVEGEPLIKGFVPTDQNKFANATQVISTCDGRITIDATGGTNTKLDYVDVTPVDPKIDFQPDFATRPTTYAEDAGGAYSATRGFGWVRQDSLSANTHVPLNLSANTVDRDPFNADLVGQRADTLIYMQYPANGSNSRLVKTPGAWEMDVPCGDYQVFVVVGDSAFSSIKKKPGDTSVHRINIEGTNAISGFVPTDQTKFQSATRTVNVCDGRLTIDAIGGTNTKLDYVDISRVG